MKVMVFVALWLLMAIEPRQLEPALVGREYSGPPLTVLASVCAPHGAVWRLERGSLPPGLALRANGAIQGVPEQPGEWRFVVRAELGCGAERRAYTLDVVPLLVLEARPAALEFAVRLGEPVHRQWLRVTGNQPGLAYTLETRGPPWLTARQRAGVLPPAGAALMADVVEVTLDGARILPGKHRGELVLSTWRGVAPLRVPVEIDARAPAPVPVALPIAQRLTPLPVPPLPLFALPLTPPQRLTPTPSPPPAPPAATTLSPLPAPASARAPTQPLNQPIRSRPPARYRRFAASRPPAGLKRAAPPTPAAPPAQAAPPPAPAAKPAPPAKPSPVGEKVPPKPNAGHH
jgi:hypothetical protein